MLYFSFASNEDTIKKYTCTCMNGKIMSITKI